MVGRIFLNKKVKKLKISKINFEKSEKMLTSILKTSFTKLHYTTVQKFISNNMNIQLINLCPKLTKCNEYVDQI